MSDVDGAADAHVDAAPPDGQTSDQASDAEARARRLGWVGQDEFRGDPSRWRPADEFLRRGEELLPVALENNRKLQDQLERMSTKMADIEKVSSEFRDFASKAEERAYKQARADIEREMRTAVSYADPAAFDNARAKLDELDRERPTPPQAKPAAAGGPTLAPEVEGWIRENPWFNTDQELNDMATVIHGRILRERPGMSLSANLAEVKAEVMRRFPDKFGNARRSAPATVSTPSGGPVVRPNSKRSYDALPADAKAQCDKFVRTIPGYTKEQYCKVYQWD